MPITVVCPACKAKLKAPDTLVGKTVKCPGCTKPVLVKATVAAPSTPVPAVKKPVRQPAPPVLDEEPFDDEEPVKAEVPARTKKKRRIEEENGDEELGEELLDDEDENSLPRPKKKDKRESQPAKTGSSTDSERTMALCIHIGAHVVNLIAGGLGYLVPIILWVMKRKDSRFIDHHGKTWLNFSITLFVVGLGLMLGFGLLGVLIGMIAGWGWAMIAFVLMIVALAALGIYGLIMNVVAGLKAKKGEWYEYRVLFKVMK